MIEIQEILLPYIAMLGPSAVAIFGLIGTVIFVLAKVREIAKDIKGDSYNTRLERKYDEIDKKLHTVTELNRELIKQNIHKDKQINMLIDQLARCEGYHEQIEETEENP